MAAEWIDTFLPKGVRRAWEEQHPALRREPAQVRPRRRQRLDRAQHR
jgi:hypothetical protein